MINKKANIRVLLIFFLALFLILIIGFIMIVGSATLNWVLDETVPELSSLGEIGGSNMTEIASFTIAPLNNIIQSFTWMSGLLYVMMIIGSFALAFLYRGSANKWLIGFFICLVLLLILASMLMSNIYEEFYDGTDELAIRLKEHVLLSFMILYSPLIFTIIAFISGAIMFIGVEGEGL